MVIILATMPASLYIATFIGLLHEILFTLCGQKSKRAPKVEVGTGARDASMDEWLQVCGFKFEICVKKFQR